MTMHDGYVMDVAYPAHFHKEIQPVWLASLTSFIGSAAPDISQPYAYCELGCGLGINLLVSAATNPQGQFVGVDFNAQHLATAQQAAQSMGLNNVRFVHADFSTFARQNTLFFDFIVSHGVWSWIAPGQQRDVLDIVARSLKPRGLFYVHYMCHPGATKMLPAQKLLNELSHHLTGSSTQNLQAGLGLLARLEDAGVFHDQPAFIASLKSLQGKDPAYLAHDFLNDHWAPMHSADMHRTVAHAGLSYLGSADCFENIDALSVPGAAQQVLATLTSPALRELVKDMARNQHQRRDLFQKAPVSLSAEEHLHAVNALRFCLLPGAPASGGVTFETPIGTLDGPAALFSPLLARLAKAPATFQELSTLPPFAGKPGLLAQSLQMLMWKGHIHPLRQDGLNSSATAAALDAWITRQQLAIRMIEACGTATHAAPDTAPF
jgi:SAM-dependent methyltransferase